MPENALRLASVAAARDALDRLRNASVIGDEAFRLVEQELDREELSASSEADR